MYLIQALLRSLAPFLANERESGHLFAKQIEKQTKKYFAFVLDPDSNDFLPVFWCATFLSPVHKLVLSPEQRKVAATVYKIAEFRARAIAHGWTPEAIFDAITRWNGGAPHVFITGPGGAGKSAVVG